MSQRKLIYTKRFESNDLSKITGEHDTEIEHFFKKLPSTAEEMLKDYQNNTLYMVNMERAKGKDVFLTTVKELCETYEIDVDIYEQNFGYVADLHLCMAMYSGTLKNLISKAILLADCLDIFKAKDEDENYDFLYSLTYYTHDRYYKGVKKEWF